MGQFRLYDSSIVVNAITSQVTSNAVPTGRSIRDALHQYLDSLPGIFLLIAIVVGLALALIFLSTTFLKKDDESYLGKLMPCLIATASAALFFIIVGGLQGALAFTADIDAGTVVLGSLATLLFTLPVAFINYTPVQATTSPEVTEKTKALMSKLQILEDELKIVKENVSVDVSSPEGKMLVIKDSLEDTLRKSELGFYKTQDLNRKFEELKKFGRDIDGLESELDTILYEFQVFANCEFSNCIGKLKDIGFDVKSTVSSDFEKGMPLDARIQAIKQILEGGRIVAQDVIQVTEPLYGIIRYLYDPSLPEKNKATELTLQRLEEKESAWIALEALYSALNNWRRQYGADILDSVKYLKNSLTPIASLSGKSDVLPLIFGEDTQKVLEYAKKAEAIRLTLEKKADKDPLNIIDIIALMDGLQSFLGISKDILSILYTDLTYEEDAIERLLPTKDYYWEENNNLRERLKKATETLSTPQNYKANQIMENLPIYLSYVDEAVQKLAVDKERKEFLLNYPTAEAAIEERLKQKKSVSSQDLPFQTKFAGEYLRLYYTQRFGEFSFDKENLQLAKNQ
jgi:hypothetical protein